MDPGNEGECLFGGGDPVDTQGEIALIEAMTERFNRAMLLSHLMTDPVRHREQKRDLLNHIAKLRQA